MAAAHGFQVFWLGILARADSYQMGIPAVPLRELYTIDAPGSRSATSPCTSARWSKQFETTGGRVCCARVAGAPRTADFYISALPFERVPTLLGEAGPDVGRVHAFADHRHSSLVRPQHHRSAARRAARPHHPVDVQQGRGPLHAAGGERVAHRSPKCRAQEVIDLALRELAEFFPRAREAGSVRAQVVKEVRATFSATPGLEHLRPGADTGIAEPVPCRRLDAIGLAGHYGRRGTQRLSGSRGRHRRGRRAETVPASGHCVNPYCSPAWLW